MHYRRLGTTGLQVSPLCLGTWRFGKESDGVVETSREDAHELLDAFAERGIPLPEPPSQIVPLMTGSTDDTLEAGRIVREEGLYAVPIRHPTVPRNEGRLRFSLRADHSRDDLGKLIDAVDRLDQADLIKRSDIWSL